MFCCGLVGGISESFVSCKVPPVFGNFSAQYAVWFFLRSVITASYKDGESIFVVLGSFVNYVRNWKHSQAKKIRYRSVLFLPSASFMK